MPENLISQALKTPEISTAVVCAGQEILLESIKKATEKKFIKPILIGNQEIIHQIAKKINFNIQNVQIINEKSNIECSVLACKLAKENKIKIIVKGNLHTDILMRVYLKKEFGLIEGKRLSHIWYMSANNLKKPLFITDGALNVSPRVDVKLHILKNSILFAKKIGLEKPKVALLSGTEDPIESMPSSIEAKKVMDQAVKENLNALIYGPLALDNAISKEAAKIKNINNDVAGDADILLVPNLETGNSLSKIMVYFMDACAAGIVTGGKVPVVVPSRADNATSKLASILAAIIDTQ
ncbi:MAG: phosphate acetyltransferase [Rickettsiales bacterium]|nr:phosphate acetyltransferase [Rickettsiales bacterium]